MAFAERKREDLASLLLSVGPNAPTLCEGWTTWGLTNRLYIRENRPDTTGGMFVKALLDHLDAATAEVNRMSHVGMVGKRDSSTPWWNPMNWADRYINTAENFVRHEDVRCAQEGWIVRQPSPPGVPNLWRLVTTAGRMMSRGLASTVVLMRDDGIAVTLIGSNAKDAPIMTVRGNIGGLVSWLYGRDEVRVPIDDNESGIKRNSL